MGFAAAWVSFKGTHVGQTAKSIPDDYSVQSESARQFCPSLQKGVYSCVLKTELMFFFFFFFWSVRLTSTALFTRFLDSRQSAAFMDERRDWVFASASEFQKPPCSKNTQYLQTTFSRIPKYSVISHFCFYHKEQHLDSSLKHPALYLLKNCLIDECNTDVCASLSPLGLLWLNYCRL